MSEREEIARIARDFLSPGSWGVRESDYLLADRIMPVIEAVRQEEREKAARVAEDHAPEREPGDDEWAAGFEAAQEAIARAIGEQGKEQDRG